MHGSQQQVRQLLQDMESKAGELSEDVEIGVCPTYVHIADLVAARSSDRIMLGAQNVHAEPEGAFTGEVSAPMLADYGLHFVIVGHSERREIFGESDQLISEKFIAVQKSKMVPILCVGETLLQREAGETEEVVLRQLDVVIDASQFGPSAQERQRHRNRLSKCIRYCVSIWRSKALILPGQ